MKRIRNFIASILVLITTFTFFSCDNLINGDTTYNDAPTVDTFTNGITIGLTYRSADTDFIYIYRKSTDGTVCIGRLNQNAFDLTKTQGIFQFEDDYVDTSKEYRYCAIYHDSVTDEYNQTSWSICNDENQGTTDKKAIKPKAGYGEIAYASTDVSGVTYSGNPDYSLTFGTLSAITDPASPALGFYPVLGMSYTASSGSKVNKYFVLTTDTTTQTSYEVRLRNILSDDFIGKDITFENLVGQYIEKNPDGVERRTYWTKPLAKNGTDFSILDSDSTEVTTINIESSSGTGVVIPAAN